MCVFVSLLKSSNGVLSSGGAIGDAESASQILYGRCSVWTPACAPLCLIVFTYKSGLGRAPVMQSRKHPSERIIGVYYVLTTVVLFLVMLNHCPFCGAPLYSCQMCYAVPLQSSSGLLLRSNLKTAALPRTAVPLASNRPCVEFSL